MYEPNKEDCMFRKRRFISPERKAKVNLKKTMQFEEWLGRI